MVGLTKMPDPPGSSVPAPLAVTEGRGEGSSGAPLPLPSSRTPNVTASPVVRRRWRNRTSTHVLCFLVGILAWSGAAVAFYADRLDGRGGMAAAMIPLVGLLRSRLEALSTSVGQGSWARPGTHSSNATPAEQATISTLEDPAAPAAGSTKLRRRQRQLDAADLSPALGASTRGAGGCAIMTMIAGNGAARHAVALLQSLRDVNTRVDDIVIMLQRGGSGSPECKDGTWRAANNLSHDSWQCGGPDATAPEIVSPFFLKILKRLGATLVVTPEIPRTPYTSGIAGGATKNLIIW